MRKLFSCHPYYLSFALAGLFLFGGAQYTAAYLPPIDCEGPYLPGQQFDATPDPAPKNNQFACAVGFALGDTPVPTATNFYRCTETTGQELFCKHYLNPTIDYYTCTYYGTGAHIGASYFDRILFDNCTRSLVPPTVTLNASPSTLPQGSSSMLTWTVANATSCSSSWVGAIPAMNGSQLVTPPVTTAYTLSCTGAGTSQTSITVSVTPPPDTVDPTDPSGLSASAASASQINLTWTASTDSGGSGLAGYKIERCSGGGCTNFLQVALSAGASYSDTGLTVSTSYSYRVRAYDNATNNSVGYSNTDSATTWTLPDSTPPSASSLSGVAFSSTQINLLWTASTDNVGVAGYRVYRGIMLIYTAGSTTMTYSDLGLTPSTTYSYYVAAFDAAGNATNSNAVNVSTPAIPDTEPPTFTFSSPAATLSAGTTFATLAGSTNETATCRYGTASGLVFASMTLFSTTGTTNHSQIITGLTNGTLYTYYVKCRDTAGNTNIADFSYMFQVDSPAPDVTPPVISNGAPTGVLAAGTLATTMSVITNENAWCRYNSDSDMEFLSMTKALDNADFRNHSVPLTGLTNGSSYLYYVRCQDNPAGNSNTAGYAIAFSVAFPANVNPVALITVTPTLGTAPITISADGNGSYDTDGSIVQYRWNWGDGSPNTIGAPNASHAYTTAGTYMLSLTIIDNQGGSGNASQTIIVSAAAVSPPPPAAISICTAACTTDADCAPNICGPSRFCIAQGIGLGPIRSDGYLSRSNGSMSQPTPAVFPAGTTSVIMSVKTDVNAECQYSTFINTPYGESVMKTFSTTDTTAHAVTLTGLAKTTAVTYDYYVRCRDVSTTIVNDTDYTISFTANAPSVVSGPNPYTCLINSNFIRNNIPYLFDICIPR